MEWLRAVVCLRRWPESASSVTGQRRALIAKHRKTQNGLIHIQRFQPMSVFDTEVQHIKKRSRF